MARQLAGNLISPSIITQDHRSAWLDDGLLAKLTASQAGNIALTRLTVLKSVFICIGNTRHPRHQQNRNVMTVHWRSASSRRLAHGNLHHNDAMSDRTIAIHPSKPSCANTHICCWKSRRNHLNQYGVLRSPFKCLRINRRAICVRQLPVSFSNNLLLYRQRRGAATTEHLNYFLTIRDLGARCRHQTSNVGQSRMQCRARPAERIRCWCAYGIASLRCAVR